MGSCAGADFMDAANQENSCQSLLRFQLHRQKRNKWQHSIQANLEQVISFHRLGLGISELKELIHLQLGLWFAEAADETKFLREVLACTSSDCRQFVRDELMLRD